MHSFMDAKILAKNLRQSLADSGVALNHGECLELVARQFGLKDWNQLSARIAAVEKRAATDVAELPEGWRLSRQTDRTVYRIGMDAEAIGVAQIACRHEREDGIILPPDSYGVMMQSISAAPYRGQKIALLAAIETVDADAASVWMRVDQALGQVLRFDNMLDRSEDGALRGTHPWTARRIVLDIPENATSIHYGRLLNGYGRMCARDLTISKAQGGWPTTAGGRKILERPTNLTFLSAT